MIYSSSTENNTFVAVSGITCEELKNHGIKVFMLIYDILISNDNYQTDNVDLVYNIQGKIGKTTFYKG